MKPKLVTVQPSEVVLSAIYNLGGKEGSSEEEIINYISKKYGIDKNHVRPYIVAALKRGTNFGILTYRNGRYEFEDVPEPPTRVKDSGDGKEGAGQTKDSEVRNYWTNKKLFSRGLSRKSKKRDRQEMEDKISCAIEKEIRQWKKEKGFCDDRSPKRPRDSVFEGISMVRTGMRFDGRGMGTTLAENIDITSENRGGDTKDDKCQEEKAPPSDCQQRQQQVQYPAARRRSYQACGRQTRRTGKGVRRSSKSGTRRTVRAGRRSGAKATTSKGSAKGRQGNKSKSQKGRPKKVKDKQQTQKPAESTSMIMPRILQKIFNNKSDDANKNNNSTTNNNSNSNDKNASNGSCNKKPSKKGTPQDNKKANKKINKKTKVKASNRPCPKICPKACPKFLKKNKQRSLTVNKESNKSSNRDSVTANAPKHHPCEDIDY